jgi:hypothetical protein
MKVHLQVDHHNSIMRICENWIKQIREYNKNNSLNRKDRQNLKKIKILKKIKSQLNQDGL